MALSSEDRAVLDLTLRHGMSYWEIDETLGSGEGEARDRARAAVAELVSGAPGIEVVDYLLGEGGSRERDFVAGDPAANREARLLAGRLREEIPGAEVPEVPELDTEAAGQSSPWKRRAATGLAALVAIGVGLGAAALLTGDSDDPAPSPETAQEESEAPPRPVRVDLAPTELGSGARGEAAIGLDDEFAPFLDLDLTDLPRAAKGSIYVAWIDIGDERGIPVPSPIAVSDHGSFRGRVELALPILGVLDVARELQVLTIDRAQLTVLQRQVAAAVEQREDEPALALDSPGGAVLSGEIPRR